MDSFVTRLWRALTRPVASTGRPGAGARVLPSYAALGRYQLHTPDLEPRLRLLVTQLAAERSGCRWCIERGRHLWREAQLSLDELRALPRYETSSRFTNRERAALRFADALTRYSDATGGMPLESLQRARQQLSEAEVAAVTAAVAAAHFYDPVTGALGADAASGQMPRHIRARNFWL